MLLLPPKLTLTSYNGDWNAYEQAVYKVFFADFIQSKPRIPNREVRLKSHPKEKGKEATYWHFISTGSDEATRNICVRRCECIAWIKPIIENYSAPNVRWWIESRSGKSGTNSRVHICVEDFSYLVVLDDRGNFILPWTAYPIEYTHSQAKLRKRWQNAEISSESKLSLF